MSNLSRWDPFGEMLSLRDAMSQLLQESVIAPGRAGTGLGMALNVSERPDSYCVEVALPGARPEDVAITLQQHTLTITAETRQEQRRGGEQEQFHVLERRYGRMSRTITLPQEVDADQIQATLEHGILRLEIPKAAQVQARTIRVQSASSGQGQARAVGAGGQPGASQGDQQELRRDQELMDRAAEAGISGAGGANPEAGQTREQLRQDAERAFGGPDSGSGGSRQEP